MKLILDACVAISMLVEEDDTPAARALQTDFKKRIHELIAPDSLPLEIAHALTRAERQGKIAVGEGQIVFDDFLDPCPTLYPYFDYLDRAMQLSSKFRIGVFDCLYAALAEEQECKEAFLAYHFLHVAAAPPTQDELDGRIEQWLRKSFDVDLDFEVDDALGKLDRLGLLRRDGGRLSVLPLDMALAQLDRVWDNFFRAPEAATAAE